MWFIVFCTLTDNGYVSLLVPKHFFALFLHNFLKGKSDAYRQLICIMQHIGVFSCQDKCLFRYL